METETKPNQALYMAGRCRTGSDRTGPLYHLVMGGQYDALCGAYPKSFWSAYPGTKVTCPRCLRKMQKFGIPQPSAEEK